MLTSTRLRSFRRICDVIGPTQLSVIWAVSIFIGWAGAGRHSALILWVLIGGVALSCVGLAFWFTGTLKLRRLRFAHRRFEQQGRKDARRLADQGYVDGCNRICYSSLVTLRNGLGIPLGFVRCLALKRRDRLKKN